MTRRVRRRVRARGASGRRGATLLEVLVALAVVAVAGVSAAALAADAGRAAARVRARDVAVRRASAFLDAVALWPREDLDRHLGDRAEGPWTLRVGRPAPTLYEVTLLAGPANGTADDFTALGAPGAVLFATSLYRPEPPRGVRP